MFSKCRYHMDPSGTFVQCDARAIGSASEGAQSSLQEVYHKVSSAHLYSNRKLTMLLNCYIYKLLSCIWVGKLLSFKDDVEWKCCRQSFLNPYRHKTSKYKCKSPSWRVVSFRFVSLSPWQSMTLKDAIKSSLTILKQVMEEKLNATNIEVCLSFLTVSEYLFLVDLSRHLRGWFCPWKFPVQPTSAGLVGLLFKKKKKPKNLATAVLSLHKTARV